MSLRLHQLRRLAASGSPVLFTGVIALAGLVISSVTKDVHLNPLILLVLLAVLALLLGFQMNAEYKRRTYDPKWMLTFDEDFASDDMRRKRAKAAGDIKKNRAQLADETFKSPQLDDVFDFFEGVGFLMQGDEITPEYAHQAFYYWLDGYYSAGREYIEKVQKSEPTRWECVKGLFDLTSEVEKERLGKMRQAQKILGTTDMNAFLEEEIALKV